MSAGSQAGFGITFIGAGNMAMSLVRGLLDKGFAKDHVAVSDPEPQQLARYDDLDIATFSDNRDACQGADLVVLAVKPQIAATVVRGLELSRDQTLVSIAAGISIASLSEWTTAQQPIVRCMPNTPALLGAGMSALFANDAVSSTQQQQAATVLAAVGESLWLDNESQLDAVTAVSGSGPAYFFLLMENMIIAGESLGLSRATATTLATQTAFGAARMAKDSGDDPATLRQNVTSKGGTTAAALDSMTASGVPKAIIDALEAAAKRSEELSVEFGR